MKEQKFRTWEDVINSKFVEKRTELQKTIDLSVSLRAEYRENSDTDISLVALKKLRELGFTTNIGTLYIANIIEDLYSEELLIKSLGMCDYFDLSLHDNIHYKYLVERYRINDENYYRGAIAIAIAKSESESKNINEIIYGVLDSIKKNKNNTLILNSSDCKVSEKC